MQNKRKHPQHKRNYRQSENATIARLPPDGGRGLDRAVFFRGGERFFVLGRAEVGDSSVFFSY